MGKDAADTLLQLVPPMRWDDFATKADLEAGLSAVRAEIVTLRGEVAIFRGEMMSTIAKATWLQIFATVSVVVSVAALPNFSPR